MKTQYYIASAYCACTYRFLLFAFLGQSSETRMGVEREREREYPR
jgi:hypothetical protein